MSSRLSRRKPAADASPELIQRQAESVVGTGDDSLRGRNRTGRIGTILPGDDREVARQIEQMWWWINWLKRYMKKVYPPGTQFAPGLRDLGTPDGSPSESFNPLDYYFSAQVGTYATGTDHIGETINPTGWASVNVLHVAAGYAAGYRLQERLYVVLSGESGAGLIDGIYNNGASGTVPSGGGVINTGWVDSGLDAAAGDAVTLTPYVQPSIAASITVSGGWYQARWVPADLPDEADDGFTYARKNGSGRVNAGRRTDIDFVEGSNVTLTVTDDDTASAVRVQIAAASGSGYAQKGAWSGATAYVVDDVVTSSGSSYVCILAHTNQAPPNTTYWALVASKGDAGATGPSGVTTRQLTAVWQGDPVVGSFRPIVVPRYPGASDTVGTFTLKRARIRVEAPSTSGSVVAVIEKSAGGNAVASWSTVATLTLTSGNYELDVTAALGTVDSGDLLRVRFTGIGTGAANFTVVLTGEL